MPRYYLEISEEERFRILVSVSHRIGSNDFGYSDYPGYLDLLRRLLEAPPLPEGQASAQAPRSSGNSAAVSPATGAGSPPFSPTVPERVSELGELTITPVSVEQSGKAMVVTYQIRTGGKVRTTKAWCWEPKLFSDLVASQGQVITFLTKESKGFLNIVGVKA